MEELGVRLEPHPCDRGCIWTTFGEDVLRMWHIFQLVTKRWEDHKTKEPRFEIDWAAVDFVFAAYGIDNKQEGVEQIFKIIGLIAHPKELSIEVLFGLDEDT